MISFKDFELLFYERKPYVERCSINLQKNLILLICSWLSKIFLEIITAALRQLMKRRSSNRLFYKQLFIVNKRPFV